MQDRRGPHLPSLEVRPSSVTLLACGVLMIGIINLIRFIQAVQQWSFLALLLPFTPLYLAASGFIWALISLALVWILWTGRRWARGIMLLYALAYTLYYWVDHLLASGSGLSGSWLFAACINILLLAYTIWALSLRSVKCFFNRQT